MVQGGSKNNTKKKCGCLFVVCYVCLYVIDVVK